MVLVFHLVVNLFVVSLSIQETVFSSPMILVVDVYVDSIPCELLLYPMDYTTLNLLVV